MGMLRKVAFRPTCGEDGVEPKGEQQGDKLSDGGDVFIRVCRGRVS
jgi:hypothetical protein